MGLLDTVNAGINSVNDSINRAKSLIGSIDGNGGFDGAVSLTYPLDLRESTNQYPILRFFAVDETGNDKEIFLPLPQGGISFNDSGQYGQIDLGVIAGTFADTMRSQGAAGIGNASSEFWSKAVNTYKQGQAASILANIVTDNQKLKYAAGQGNKLLPPNTNTTFTNNSLRQFAFQFKLTASSRQGSEAIRNIVSTFRRLTYASNATDEETLILNYPPVWTLSFLDWNDGALGDNAYLPKIGESYLTSFSTVYNASSNLLHTDGAPTEVDITLNFQEARVNTRQDIDKLEQNGTY